MSKIHTIIYTYIYVSKYICMSWVPEEENICICILTLKYTLNKKLKVHYLKFVICISKCLYSDTKTRYKDTKIKITLIAIIKYIFYKEKYTCANTFLCITWVGMNSNIFNILLVFMYI